MDIFKLVDCFTLQEAFELIHRKVVLDENDEAGFVCGLLVFNPEVEVVVKFAKDLKQFNKTEFFNAVRLVIDG